MQTAKDRNRAARNRVRNSSGQLKSRKRCGSCKKVKRSDCFWRNRTADDGLQSRCIDCQQEERDAGYLKAYHRRRKRLNPSIHRHGVVRRYGITLDEYDRLFKKQKGCCAICRRPQRMKRRGRRFKSLSVDHNHKTKRVRGLLCSGCNARLASLENKKWIRRALAYLRASCSA